MLSYVCKISDNKSCLFLLPYQVYLFVTNAFMLILADLNLLLHALFIKYSPKCHVGGDKPKTLSHTLPWGPEEHG